MTYDRSIISVIEDAISHHPFCEACGSRTVVRTDGDRILLECAATGQPGGLLARLRAALLPHARIVVT